MNRTRAMTSVRIAAHAAVWAAVLVPTIQEVVAGWRPMLDDASIAIRSYQAFSLHPPLVGLPTTASSGTGQTLYDPGPLAFYLLAAPVHLSPSYGLLIGSAILAGAAFSLAIEAAWSARQWVAALVLVAVVLDLLWLVPSVFQNLPWNAYFPLPFFIVSLMFAWLVCIGRVVWWPVLVATGSVAGQSHLLFLVPCAVLICVSFLIGISRLFEERDRGSPDRSSDDASDGGVRTRAWIFVGIGVGIVCWIAPVVQELGGNGNLSALARARGSSATFGPAFGLGQIAHGIAWPPLWLTRPPGDFFDVFLFVDARQGWWGAATLGILILITVGAFVLGERRLAALAAVVVFTGLGLAYSFAIYPLKNGISMGYLIYALWVLAVLEWAVAIWTVLCVGRHVLGRLHLAGVRPASTLGPAAIRWAPAAALVVALASATALAGRAAWSSPAHSGWNTNQVIAVGQAVRTIESASPRGPVEVRVKGGSGFGTIETAIAFRLLVDGWSPGVDSLNATYTGLTTPTGSHPRTYVVFVTDHDRIESVDAVARSEPRGAANRSPTVATGR